MTEVRADSRLNITGTEVRSTKVETAKEEEEGEFCRSYATSAKSAPVASALYGPAPAGIEFEPLVRG